MLNDNVTDFVIYIYLIEFYNKGILIIAFE